MKSPLARTSSGVDVGQDGILSYVVQRLCALNVGRTRGAELAARGEPLARGLWPASAQPTLDLDVIEFKKAWAARSDGQLTAVSLKIAAVSSKVTAVSLQTHRRDFLIGAREFDKWLGRALLDPTY